MLIKRWTETMGFHDKPSFNLSLHKSLFFHLTIFHAIYLNSVVYTRVQVCWEINDLDLNIQRKSDWKFD